MVFAMYAVHPRYPRLRRGLGSFLLLAASVFPWPAQQALASKINGTLHLAETNSNSEPLPWYLTEANNNSPSANTPSTNDSSSTSSRSWYLTSTNSSNFNFQNGNKFAQVTVSVDDSNKVTFDVNLLSKATSNNYVIDKFAFNWAGDNDIRKRFQVALEDTNGPMNRWKIRGAGGDPGVDMTGMGKFNYEIQTREDNARAGNVSLTVDLSGLGLTKDQILSHFQVASNGSDGGGFFALHFATGDAEDLSEQCLNDSFYVSGTEPATSYASKWGNETPAPPTAATNLVVPSSSSGAAGANMSGIPPVGGGGGALWGNIFGVPSAGGGLGGGGSSTSGGSNTPNPTPSPNPSPNPSPTPSPTPPGPPGPPVNPKIVPEPSSLLLMAFVVGILLLVLRFRPRVSVSRET